MATEVTLYSFEQNSIPHSLRIILGGCRELLL